MAAAPTAMLPVAAQQSRSAGTSELDQLRLEHTKNFLDYVKKLGLLEKDHQLASGTSEFLQHSEEVAENEQPPSKRSRVLDAPAMDQSSALECDAHSPSWICRARRALLRPGLGGTTPETPAAWRQEAVARWGPKVPEERSIRDWESYVRSRLPVLDFISPLDIMQERYAYDAWRLLVACTLMSRINSERIKEGVIGRFFKFFPSPSRFLARTGDEDNQLQETLRPLGLVENRIKTVVEVSQNFLHMPSFDCGHKKGGNKISGCGPFAVDSFLIFFRGCLLAETADASCIKYLEWRRSNSGQHLQHDHISQTPAGSSSPVLETPVKPAAPEPSRRVVAQDQANAAQQTSLFSFFQKRS